MIDNRVLKEYLNGNSTEQERAIIIDWFFSISKESDLRKQSLPFWDQPDDRFILPDDEAGSLLDRIQHRILLKEIPAMQKNRAVIRYMKILSTTAAVIFIALMVSLWALREEILTSSGELAYSEIVCPPGTRTIFHLPEGSKGWLNTGSSLEFPFEFKGKSREVHLEGEAYFKVVTNPKKSFCSQEITSR